MTEHEHDDDLLDNEQHSVRVPFPFADELERVHARIYPPAFRNHAEEIDAIVKGIHPNLRRPV